MCVLVHGFAAAVVQDGDGALPPLARRFDIGIALQLRCSGRKYSGLYPLEKQRQTEISFFHVVDTFIPSLLVLPSRQTETLDVLWGTGHQERNVKI